MATIELPPRGGRDTDPARDGAGGMRNVPTPLLDLAAPGSTRRHFRRDHHPPPALGAADWRLVIEGAVDAPGVLTLEDVRALPARTLSVVLECAGHRRAEFAPAAPGLQWGPGAVGEARWTGSALRDVLSLAGVSGSASEVVLEGADRGPFPPLEGAYPFARSLPLAKALDPDTLVAYAMDDQPIPRGHGGPVRAIVPGWYATDSVKWLHRIQAVTAPFQGPFQARDYRFAEADDPGFGIRLTELPIHALICAPDGEAPLSPGVHRVCGAAWGGAGGVDRVELRIDEGPWTRCELDRSASRYGRARWWVGWDAAPGRHTLAVRASDARGETQPPAPRWNRGGYACNSIHTVRVLVTTA
jgi:DMSO/TMAO reductase YedYZ molybdopterin-dependent catalytic subunit